MEAENGSSCSSLSRVSSSISAEDKITNWETSSVNKIAQTSDLQVNTATLTANTQHIYNCGDKVPAAPGTAELKLDVSHFNVAPGTQVV